MPLAHPDRPSSSRLGDIPAFIGELGNHVVDPEPGRIRPGGRARRGRPQPRAQPRGARLRPARGRARAAAAPARGLALRLSRQELLGETDVLVAERRLDDLIDTLVVECVVAYFERADGGALRPRPPRPAHRAAQPPCVLERPSTASSTAPQRYGHGLTFVVVDLDHFKSVNDSRGHPVGDRVLRCVAEALLLDRAQLDLVARIGRRRVRGGAGRDGSHGRRGSFIEQPAASRRGSSCGRESCRRQSSFSAGFAHFQTDSATKRRRSIELADSRLYERKRAPRLNSRLVTAAAGSGRWR